MKSGAHGAPGTPCVYKHGPQSRRDVSPPSARLVMSYSAWIKWLLASVLGFRFRNPFLIKVAVAARLCLCCLPPHPGGRVVAWVRVRLPAAPLPGKHVALHLAKPSGGFGHHLPQCRLCPVFLELMFDDGQGAWAFLLRPWQSPGVTGVTCRPQAAPQSLCLCCPLSSRVGVVSGFPVTTGNVNRGKSLL